MMPESFGEMDELRQLLILITDHASSDTEKRNLKRITNLCSNHNRSLEESRELDDLLKKLQHANQTVTAGKTDLRRAGNHATILGMEQNEAVKAVLNYASNQSGTSYTIYTPPNALKAEVINELRGDPKDRLFLRKMDEDGKSVFCFRSAKAIQEVTSRLAHTGVNLIIKAVHPISNNSTYWYTQDRQAVQFQDPNKAQTDIELMYQTQNPTNEAKQKLGELKRALTIKTDAQHNTTVSVSQDDDLTSSSDTTNHFSSLSNID